MQKGSQSDAVGHFDYYAIRSLKSEHSVVVGTDSHNLRPERGNRPRGIDEDSEEMIRVVARSKNATCRRRVICSYLLLITIGPEVSGTTRYLWATKNNETHA